MKKAKYKFFSKKTVDDPAAFEAMMTNYYRGKYYNLWMNKAVIEGLDEEIKDEQNEFFMRKLWETGRVALRKFSYYGVPFRTITEYCEGEWDIYDHPTKVTLVNNRGVSTKIIPSRVLVVDRDVVLIHAQPNRKPVKEAVENCIQRMVNIDLTIQVNLATAGVGFALIANEEDADRLDDIETQILGHEKVIKISAEDASRIISLPITTAFIGEQLRAEKEAVEAELLTLMGIDNAGSMEKAERMTVDEVNAGNDLININSDVIENEMKRGIERYNRVFGDNLSLTFRDKPAKAVSEKLGGPKSGEEKEEEQEEGKE